MRNVSSDLLCRLCQILLLLVLVIPASGQDVRFTAKVSSTRVAQNTVFDVQFELQDARGSDFKPPSFEGFKVVGGPAMGSSTTIINGAVSSSQSWSYSLLAVKQGKFIIGAGSVVAGRKKLTSRPITIEVVEPRDLSAQEGPGEREPILLRAEVPEGPFYPGQQITLTYTLLFRENVQTVSTLAEDDYADFFVQHFQDIPTETGYETINGVQFATRVVKALALFAHQSGTFTIDPMLMNVGINAPFPGMQGLFTMRRIQDMQVASAPLTIKVDPLPPGAPAGFSGAVGQYSILTQPGALQISTDEALTFQLQITGDGDGRRWDPPTPVMADSFELFDPKLLEEHVEATDLRVDNIRTVLYQMIPAAPGDYTVYVPFTYFDPVAKQYVTISSDTLQVQVSQGSQKKGFTSVSDSLSAVKPALMTVRKPLFRDQFWLSVPHLVLLGLILTSSCWGWFQMTKHQQEQRIPETEKKKMAALDTAQQKLMQLSGVSDHLDTKTFFEQASEIYYTFLRERFAIPASELDEAGLEKHLQRSGLSSDDIRKAVQFFNDCLAVRYGGIPGGYSKSQMLELAGSLMTLLGA